MSGLYIKLDVEYASDEEFIEAGPMAELLYIRALCFIKRKNLDGFLKDSQLSLVAAGIPSAKKHARTLVSVGLFTAVEGGWHIPAFLKRNMSKAEIEASKDLAREAGERGAHERWCIKEGKPRAKCRFCIADRVNGVGIGNPIGGANGVGYLEEEPEEEPEPEPEPEEEEEPTPPRRPTGSTGGPTNGRTTTGSSQQRIDTVLRLLADHQMTNAKVDPVNEDRYRGQVINTLLKQHGPRIRQFVNDRPDSPPEMCAEALKKEIH